MVPSCISIRRFPKTPTINREPSYNASIMANRPRAAPTETLTAMLAAAPVVLGDGAASVAFTSEPEPDSVGEAESEPESDPEPVPVPAVNCISAFLCINGV